MALPPLEKRLTQAKSYIITRQFFFAPTLLRRQISLSTAVPTACINAAGEIKINPDWAAEFTVRNLIFLLCHECLHHMMGHALRCGNRVFWKWNWAGDAWINETLIAEGVGTFIEGGVRYPGATEMTVEELYRLAPEQPPQGGAGGSLGDDLSSDGLADMNADEIAEALAETEIELAQAAMAAKQMGNLPAAFKQLVEELLHPPTPWHKYLEQFMSRQTEDDYCFHEPDQNFRHLGMYIPSLSGEGCGDVVVIADESGSVSDQLFQSFGGHVSRVLEMANPERVLLAHVDTHVHDVDEYTPESLPLKMERKATGGTDMSVGVHEMAQRFPDADAIIVLTDGMTPFGTDPGIPVFWAISDKGIRAPYGETVHIAED